MGERKEWEYIPKNEWDKETRDFKVVRCSLIRWDFYIRESGERFFILSLGSPSERVIAQVIMNEEIATALRDAINKLLSGQIEEEAGGGEGVERVERAKVKAKKEHDMMFA